MTTAALQISKKGGLVYDSCWFKDGRLHKIINQCNSPPKLSAGVSNSGYQQIEGCSLRTQEPNPSDSCQHSTTSLYKNTRHDVPEEKATNDVMTVKREQQMLRTSVINSFQSSGTPDPSALVEVSILECQQHWKTKLKKGVAKRQNEVEEYSSQLLEQAENSCIMFDEQQNEKVRMSIQQMQNVQLESEEMRQQRIRHHQDRNKLHDKRMESKLKTARQKKAEAEVEAENIRRVTEKQAYLDSMMNVYKQVTESSKKVCLQLESYKHREFLPSAATKIMWKVQHFVEQAEHLVNDAKVKGASMDQVENMHKIVESVMFCQESTSKVIAEADRLAQEDISRKARIKASLAQQQAAVVATTKTSVTCRDKPCQKDNENTVLQETISAEALKEYEMLRNKQLQETRVYKTFTETNDVQLKKYRCDLRKAVNLTINTISDHSGTHLLKKIHRLKSLLDGQRVESSGRKESVSQITEGKSFVRDLLAEKLVKQSDEQVSSNHDSAFPNAAVAVALWCDFPEIGELILAHFYLKCPFLVPYNITKGQQQSNEDYYKSLGYNYASDGTIEKQDKYLKRMSGFMRLYAAIMVTQTVKNSSQHPYGIDHAWQWLARLLNLQPQPDITATMLFDFLEVCGNTLAAVYGKQFFMLLQVLQTNYFPKIEAVTPNGSGGPVTRLKTFLEVCIHTQRISPPKGKLQPDFWRT